LRDGKVVQIVGSTLGDDPAAVQTNFISERPAAWFAELYRHDGLTGGHVIMLGAGNDAAARSALAAYPGGLQIGGGVNATNARGWLGAGASHVIVTSWVFRGGKVDWARLAELVKLVGKDRLVLDLSCRQRGRRAWRQFGRGEWFRARRPYPQNRCGIVPGTATTGGSRHGRTYARWPRFRGSGAHPDAQRHCPPHD
jgi:phosphoribosylformimino-5-aminoimidazole carboxamide ribotide isomerase